MLDGQQGIVRTQNSFHEHRQLCHPCKPFNIFPGQPGVDQRGNVRSKAGAGDSVKFHQIGRQNIFYRHPFRQFKSISHVAFAPTEHWHIDGKYNGLTAGGFGTLLIVTGKKWATREKVFRSMRMFMEHVAPKLAGLVPMRDPDAAAA